jgi:NAD(P)-dependent dehydrogenase (short-subunit alcohol dehydrogenase family)
MTMRRLEGKSAVVTGAARGIGQATALALADEGARVVLADVLDDEGQRATDAIVASGAEAVYLHTDVTSSSDVEAAVGAAVERWGRLDVMVNDAAVAIGGSAGDMSEDDVRRVLDVNLLGVWRGMRFAIPVMLEQGGGSIVNLSSVQGHVGFVGWAAYAASKGGIDALTRQAAVEYASRGIRINSVIPGTIRTEMNEKILEESPDADGLMRTWTSMHPMGRIGEAGEVASAIVFLASDESSFITGECLRVDGGMIVHAG